MAKIDNSIISVYEKSPDKTNFELKQSQGKMVKISQDGEDDADDDDGFELFWLNF